LGLRELRDKLERLGLTRSRGFRLACKYLVKKVDSDHYLAWIIIDSLGKRKRKGFEIYFYAECDNGDTMLRIAELLAKAIEELRRSGYA
jgi:hypothetical protein